MFGLARLVQKVLSDEKEASISLDRGANIPGEGFIFSQIRCEYSKRKNRIVTN